MPSGVESTSTTGWPLPSRVLLISVVLVSTPALCVLTRSTMFTLVDVCGANEATGKVRVTVTGPSTALGVQVGSFTVNPAGT